MNVSIKLSPHMASVVGALVADAAALGLHWLYDPRRIKQLEKTKGLVFLQPDAENFAGAKGFFAHTNKSAGDSSSYGEICLLMLNHWAQHGQFNRIEYQKEFRNHFGPGGTYTGYIDSPTRQTLLNLIPLTPEDFPLISGADDDQFTALASIPVITATHKGSHQALLEKVEQIVRLTNHNDIAITAAKYAAAVLAAVISGKPSTIALYEALPHADKQLKSLLNEALNIDTLDSVKVADYFGPACHVLEGLPIIAHIAQHATSFQEAIEANIRAGGDSCGRAIMLGAITAAQAENKPDANNGIPFNWLSKYNKIAIVTEACERL